MRSALVARSTPGLALLATFCAVFCPSRPASAQFVGITLDDNKGGFLPHISGSIDTFGAAAGLTGTLGYNAAEKGDATTLASGEVWAALVYRDLDRIQLSASGASHPKLAAASSYLRAAYDEYSFSATVYPLTIARNHADRAPSMLALLGLTLGYDQRNYFGLDPSLSTDRLLNAGVDLFGLVIGVPDGELPMHLTAVDISLAFELSGNDVKNTAFRAALNPIEFHNLQLSSASPVKHFALYLDASAGGFMYKPPIFKNGAFDLSLQYGLGGSAELHFSNNHNHYGAGVARTANLGLTAETSGIETRAYLRAGHSFFDDRLNASLLAFLGKATAHESTTGNDTSVTVRGVSAEVGFAPLSWMDFGVHGDFGLSPYFANDKTAPQPNTALLGYDVGAFVRLAWSKGQGSATGVPSPH